jgi:hypothetical protein
MSVGYTLGFGAQERGFRSTGIPRTLRLGTALRAWMNVNNGGPHDCGI